MILQNKVRVLVVDDTIVYRKAISDIVEEIPCAELVGVAHNGKIALEKIKQLKPDLLTLDVEMPVMNGIETLSEIGKRYPGVGAVMLSTLTAEGSDMTLKALELGAFDFILKPQQSAHQAESKRILKALLKPIIETYSRSARKTSSLRKTEPVSAGRLRRLDRQPPLAFTTRRIRNNLPGVLKTAKSEIVTIGISTGGPNALNQILPQIPGDIGVPILIVQHMPPLFTQSLAVSLDKKCSLRVKEAVDREQIQPNVVYIAPGGKQMKLIASGGGNNRQIKITDDPPENSCKPAVDYLFRSIADYYVNRTTAVIMTGMGHDGTKGLELLKTRGAHIIAQDESSCVVFGMPKVPIESGLVDVIAPLNKIAEEIVKSVR